MTWRLVTHKYTRIQSLLIVSKQKVALEALEGCKAVFVDRCICSG